MTAQRHLYAIAGGRSPATAAANGRPTATPQDDEVRLGALTVQLHKSRARGPVRLQLAGELDTAMADEFQQAIEVGWALGSGKLVIDLRDLAFMDLTSVEILLNAQRRAAQDGSGLGIIVGDAASRVLERTGVLGFFEVIPAAAEPAPR
jgi:anti-anti-sigma factor